MDGVAAVPAEPPRWRWLPPVGSARYYLLLGLLGMGLLGPLGAVTAAYMNFSLGFFVGGQVLAGILGSAVTFGYGAQGQHGANYIQTSAASVAGLGGLGVLLQAQVWMGMPPVPAWQMVLYLTCVGLLGVGVGMLYTPLLVDRMRLSFPSGAAVAHLLRALTDPGLLRRSLVRLAGGAAAGLVTGLGAGRIATLGAIEWSASTFGAGLVVGARVGLPAALAGGLAWLATPGFVAIGWLAPGDPFRKITFLIALGLILGAGLVDLARLACGALRRTPPQAPPAPPESAGPRVRMGHLVMWVLAWAGATALAGVHIFGESWSHMAVTLALVGVFALINGIAVGVSDYNPISSAFVVTVLVLAAFGLRDPLLGLMAGAVLLVATSVASDMQQDRSTGWRLGSNRALQFRFQVAGLLVGALIAVGLAQLFLAAYPVLRLDQTLMKADETPAQWSSAMTYKLVGALRSLSDPGPHQIAAIAWGAGIGVAVQALRAAFAGSAWRERLLAGGPGGQASEFLIDAVLLPSPYASSFGGFVTLPSSLWFGAGGVAGSAWRAWQARQDRRPPPDGHLLPSDMDGPSLVGGGLIAGDALAALALGLAGLIALA